MNLRIMLIALLATALAACSKPASEPEAPVDDPAAPADESAALAEDAGAKGAALLAPFKMNLMQAFSTGMQEGPVSAIAVCRDEAPGIAASLSVDGVRMGRSSHKLRNPDNAPPEWLRETMEHWAATDIQSHGETTVVSAVFELDGGRHGYAEPIFVQPVCLTCHGSNIEAAVAARTAELYPDDRATGFAVGDFRGVFWVEFGKGGPAQGAGPQPCTEEWRQFVEERVPTADGRGHGPDIGSIEWQSVVEFKLGVRGNPDVPARESDAWCRYVDEKIRESILGNSQN